MGLLVARLMHAPRHGPAPGKLRKKRNLRRTHATGLGKSVAICASADGKNRRALSASKITLCFQNNALFSKKRSVLGAL